MSDRPTEETLPLPSPINGTAPSPTRAANRRQFLWLALGAGGAAALGLASLWRRTGTGSNTAGATAPRVEGWATAQRTSRALGTDVSMLALHRTEAKAHTALDAAFAELETVEEIMSIYRPQSQLCRLNRHGALDDPHPYLVQVLQTAQRMSERSGGTFDVTVQPLWDVYARAQRSGHLPDSSEILAAVAKVDWRKLEISAQRIRLKKPGMAVTLNGIAQGFAADRALAALREQGVAHALVNTGEVGTLGRKTDGSAWTVGIQHPREASAFAALAKLEGKCLSTSGDYATTFSTDHVYHHIFDPATGVSPAHFSSVTVVADCGMDADALTKPLFIMGVECGLAFIKNTPGASALMIRKDGTMLKTADFPLTTGASV